MDCEPFSLSPRWLVPLPCLGTSFRWRDLWGLRPSQSSSHQSCEVGLHHCPLSSSHQSCKMGPTSLPIVSAQCCFAFVLPSQTFGAVFCWSLPAQLLPSSAAFEYSRERNCMAYDLVSPGSDLMLCHVCFPYGGTLELLCYLCYCLQ